VSDLSRSFLAQPQFREDGLLIMRNMPAGQTTRHCSRLLHLSAELDLFLDDLGENQKEIAARHAARDRQRGFVNHSRDIAWPEQSSVSI
jgi:hypothetical protein